MQEREVDLTAMGGKMVIECAYCGVMLEHPMMTVRKIAQWNRWGRVCPRDILKAWRRRDRGDK